MAVGASLPLYKGVRSICLERTLTARMIENVQEEIGEVWPFNTSLEFYVLPVYKGAVS